MLGPVTVVPDGYADAPANAVHESDYKRMLEVYGRIDSGKSQVSVDTANFFEDANGKAISMKDDPKAYADAVKRADAFRGQYMGYLADLVKTPAGLEMLGQLDHSKFATTIAHSDHNHVQAADWDGAYVDKKGHAGKGTANKVGVNPDDTTWPAAAETCKSDHVEPWTQDRAKFGFYHELVHAYYYNRGEGAIDGHNHSACADNTEIANWEWQAAGLGPFAKNTVSENTIRQQMGAPPRPTYGGTHYNDPDPKRAPARR